MILRQGKGALYRIGEHAYSSMGSVKLHYSGLSSQPEMISYVTVFEEYTVTKIFIIKIKCNSQKIIFRELRLKPNVGKMDRMLLNL